MNMKKIKKFFTLARRHDGFTLVELIVVIAILAILGGVAVPAYSGYVKKANMQADISLAAEVADALTLYYYSHPGEVTSGYVVITPEGNVCVYDEDATTGVSVGKAAMDAVFGAGWEENLSLKYDGWIEASAGGGNVTNIETGTITNAISSMTNLAGAASNANKPGTITNVLKNFAGLNDEQKAELQSYESEDNYGTIATNLMVKYLADELSKDDVVFDTDAGAFTYADGTALSGGANMAMTYAMLFSMANDSSNPNSAIAQERLDAFTDTVQDIADREANDANSTSVGAELDEALGAMLMDPVDGIPFAVFYSEYLGSNPDEITNISAALGVMSDMAEGYSDKDTLGDGNLFSSDTVVNAINAYKLAAQHGGIAISINDGVCTVVPNLLG